MRLLTCLILGLLILSCKANAVAVDLSCNLELQMGKEFLVSRDKEAALYQFKRVLFLCDEKSLKEETEYLIAVAELTLHKTNDAEARLLSIVNNETHQFREQASILLGYVLEQKNQPQKVRDYLIGISEYEFNTRELLDCINYKLAWLDLKQGNLDEASKYLRTIKGPPELYESAKNIINAYPELNRLPQKSPVASGALSALLPGAGQFYVGRYRDGITAFVVNALFLGATIQAFEHDQEFLGVILGAFELGWYGGNIYNAINSAHKYNRKVREDFLGRFKDELSLEVLTTRKSGLGVLFGLRF